MADEYDYSSHEKNMMRLLNDQQEIADGSTGPAVGQQTTIFQPVVFTKPNAIRIGSRVRIDSFTKIEGGHGVTIGDDVHIASFAHLNIGGGTLQIGNGAAVASGVRIITGGNAPDAVSCSAVAPAEQQVLHASRVTIAKNACVYAGATICPGVTIGEGARVAAGAVVTKNIPPFEIWCGNPARFMRRRQDVGSLEHSCASCGESCDCGDLFEINGICTLCQSCRS